MSSLRTIRYAIMALALLTTTSQVALAATKTSLKKAMESHTVTVKATSLGGYCGKCIKLLITNNTTKALDVSIDPGLIFRPDDSAYQHLVLLGNESLALEPSASAEMVLQTFCGKSYAHGPTSNLNYTYWRQGDSNMIKTLQYVSKNNIDMHICQNAVWTFTNGHTLSSVYFYNQPDQSKKLLNYIADLRHIKAPNLFTQYYIDNRQGVAVCNRQIERQYVELRWGHDQRHAYVTIYREDGTVYRRVSGEAVLDKDGVRLSVPFDPKKDPPGTYRVELKGDENQVLYNEQVIVGGESC